ncbi:dynein heavy chain, N-terminal region 1-domain-containing protein [Dipodascopsis uninucleata]
MDGSIDEQSSNVELSTASTASAVTSRSLNEKQESGLQTHYDITPITTYLRNILAVVLGATTLDLDMSIFADTSDTSMRLKAFATEPGSSVIFVLKDEEKVERGEEQEIEGTGSTATSETRTCYVYSLVAELVAASESTVASLAVIKRPSPIDITMPIESQLQIVNLPTFIKIFSESQERPSLSPYEMLYSLVHLAIGPYFEAFAGGRPATQNKSSSSVISESEAKTGVPAAKKRFAELELSLLYLQQNIEIPQITLTFHPVIQQALDRAIKLNTTPTIDMIPSNLIADANFLNSIQATVNSWIKSIQTVTKLTRDPSIGTATQEINFWLSLEAVLEDIERQLQQDGVSLSIEVLKHAKRFHATISFAADTGLKEAMDLVKRYNLLMHEFPIDDLLSAPTLQRLKETVSNIFNHLNKRIRISPYPIKRALPLVEAISADLDRQFHSLLSGRRLMHLDYHEFQRVVAAAEEAFATWDFQVREFTNVAREVTRKRSERFIPIRIKAKHVATQERLEYLKSFRHAHEQLQITISTVLGSELQNGIVSDSETADVIEELQDAYSILRDVDGLDVSSEGTENWNNAESAYNERTSRIEDSIIVKLRSRLVMAKNANEMFRVFSKFNALFIRPKIRSAIQEYQVQLIENVKSDIQTLHDRFLKQYAKSQAYQMATLRDIPPISGAIIWVRQIDRQLNTFMKRVEDVLGSGWEQYSEGERLKIESNTFRKKLDSKLIFDSWLREVAEKKLSVSGFLFTIAKSRTSIQKLELDINFDPQMISLFKEVRNLTYLKFQVPHSIGNVAKDAKRIYPFAMSLNNSIREFTQTMAIVSELKDAVILMNAYQNDVQSLISTGLKIRWESFVHSYDITTYTSVMGDRSYGTDLGPVAFVREFSSVVSCFHHKASIVSEVYFDISVHLESLKGCAYSYPSFNKILGAIQKLIDKLNLESFSNLHVWVNNLNQQVQAVLLHRLKDAVLQWTDAFEQSELLQIGGSKSSIPSKLSLEIVMRNQLILLSPTLEFVRSKWYLAFQEWIEVISKLPRLSSSRYEVKVDLNPSDDVRLSFNELSSLAVNELKIAYVAIESKITEVSRYTSKWFQFQSLWNLQPQNVHQILNADLKQWIETLQGFRQVRNTFDTRESSKDFGTLIIEYEQIQARINAKYDSWQHDLFSHFAELLSSRMKELFAELERFRSNFEARTLDMSSTKRAISFIILVQEANSKSDSWAENIQLFRNGQIVLTRSRFQFPSDWMFVDQLDLEWSSLKDLLSKRNSAVNEQIDNLRTKVSAESKLLEEQIFRSVADWNDNKPVTGTVIPEEAFRILEKFEKQLVSLKQQQDVLEDARKSLDLDSTGTSSLENSLQEIQDFKSVWSALSTVWNNLNDLRDIAWVNSSPKKIKQSLDELLDMTKEMPSRMRQYSSFEYVQDVLRQLLKSHFLLIDLKSDIMRERHWEKLLKGMKSKDNLHYNSMTLGNVWDLDLVVHQSFVQEVISEARGEMALEEFLRGVRETWSDYALELVNYQNKCFLLRGWDSLFETCSDHLNSLSAMHHSPYFRVFESEALSWEDKLSRILSLFDKWVDMQRQWVYLEGIFSGNVEIKNLLPIEYSRFQNVNSEFFTLMRKVAKSSKILEVLSIHDVELSVDRIKDLLSRVQKVLGEYLEQERTQFPRYYFVGDEDLLEIIGNSKDVTILQKHLQKMFAGIANVIVDEENAIMTSIVSREGELVDLISPINLTKTSKVNERLKELEDKMRLSLAHYLDSALAEFRPIFGYEDLTAEQLISWISKYPAQVVLLTCQIVWSEFTENVIRNIPESLTNLYNYIEGFLQNLATIVTKEITRIDRKKCEGLITELVHERNVIKDLIYHKVTTIDDYHWISQMRFNYHKNNEILQRVEIVMATASFQYGFEYLGVLDKLVQTPLTDKCFLALTGALEQSMGGSPFGPAGTGKTETVKALGAQLGRYVLVFNCDDSFDFRSMGRILLGICQVGAWGCFDEFNRLDEKMLSAISSQIQTIQQGLRAKQFNGEDLIEIVGKQFSINSNTGVFITMNPGYAGRSNLPDNLKKLFRSVSMSRPDKELIAEVILYSQGFSQARELASRIVPAFDQLAERLSAQPHYDIGLRALKSVLVTCGDQNRVQSREKDDPNSFTNSESEIVVQSLRMLLAPKLVDDDIKILDDVESKFFPGVSHNLTNSKGLELSILQVASEDSLVVEQPWFLKVVQLNQIQSLHHGIILVGDSGTGKTSSWKVLLQSLQRLEQCESVSYVIDAKVMSKEALYGSLDSTTREWTDGLFTSIIRKINVDVRGESAKRHWIIFDGDVDPEWAENLNSVLDDNKLLTLPNGERLRLPDNVKIIFEVDSIKSATLATISRCGIVWYGSNTLSTEMIVKNMLYSLTALDSEESDDFISAVSPTTNPSSSTVSSAVAYLRTILLGNVNLDLLLNKASQLDHIMKYNRLRLLRSFFGFIRSALQDILAYNAQHPELRLENALQEKYLLQKILIGMIWSFAGDCKISDRVIFADSLKEFDILFEAGDFEDGSVLDFDTFLPHCQWSSWSLSVPNIDLDAHAVVRSDITVPTIDTIRLEGLLKANLADGKPMVLCGPPGSGKTMSLLNTLRRMPNVEVVGINFSSETKPDLIVRTLEQYCSYSKSQNKTILSPSQVGRRLVLFCDEINLPEPDNYGTQKVISFIRQLITMSGFWKNRSWVSLKNVQFIGACNPPTDVGRYELGQRFLSHVSLIMIDYPSRNALMQIYGTLNSSILKNVPSLRGYTESLTTAMIDFYYKSQIKFANARSHYIYSPRELTRWVRGIYETIKPLDSMTLEGLVRIWAHEALRLFCDRLVNDKERNWTIMAIDEIASKYFVNINKEEALKGPILYSNWLSKSYSSVNVDELRGYVKARMKLFADEFLDVSIVLYDDSLDHILRIDRVLRQPQGHMILIGSSGSGRTTLTRFVAWMNGIQVYQINSHKNYSAEDFDDDLRELLKLTGYKGQKVCFILDESNVLESGFLERMNTLLANAEVPGLFEGEDFNTLLSMCREGAKQQGQLLDTQEELYKWFTEQVIRNLHVVFTMNPPENGLASHAATSPALFNRCVLNWMGDWRISALYQVGEELTMPLDLDLRNYNPPEEAHLIYHKESLSPTHREMIINAMIHIHMTMHHFNKKFYIQSRIRNFATPRQYLDLVSQFSDLYIEKQRELEEFQHHINVGLEKLQDTVERVRHLRTGLAQKQEQLKIKSTQANQKLEQMLVDQKEAEKKQQESLQIQKELAIKETEIQSRQEIVLNDLAKAEPAVIEAQQSVKGIKKQHLTEVRSMGNPPEAVKLTMEAVCILLGHKVDSWRAVQSIIRRDDFISSIVNFDTDKQMTTILRSKMKTDYLNKSNFNFETVNRASKACGPLMQWLEAQVNYSTILEKIGPLRQEIKNLDLSAEDIRSRGENIAVIIRQLEASIEKYKEEYAILISDVQHIKSEMSKVEQKVTRSVTMLASLSSESERWRQESKFLIERTSTLAGDSLLVAGLLVYCGIFDQQFRAQIVSSWQEYLRDIHISYQTQNSAPDYLATMQQKVDWHSNNLPEGEFYEENALMIERSMRYPLIVDPTGRTVEFIKRETTGQGLIITSFLDNTFVKQLESAVRFGNALLINDAEHLDPIIIPILSKQYQQIGGRMLIKLSKREIDYSPNFRLYLFTNDSTVTLNPALCSLTTIVNFTITRNNLYSQSISELLKALRPDIDRKRNNLMKLRSEFTLNLRELEKQLLNALNESQGNILDDDNVINTLEDLKVQAGDLTQKMQETEGVMSKINDITEQYDTIALCCSTIYTLLELLSKFNRYYQFSLEYFDSIFTHVLSQYTVSQSSDDFATQKFKLIRSIYTESYRRTSRSLLNSDKLLFAIFLAYSRAADYNTTMLEQLFDKEYQTVDLNSEGYEIKALLTHISNSTLFSNFGITDETSLYNFMEADFTDVNKRLCQLLFMKLTRSELYVDAGLKFVTDVFDSDLSDPESTSDISMAVEETTSMIPIVMLSIPGFDASYKIENLSISGDIKCISVAMGAEEGTTSAEKAIAEKAINGGWIILKNVHLVPEWLSFLEKKLHLLKPVPDFKLFLCMELTSFVPVSLLQSSRLIMNEPPPGLRASLKDTFCGLNQEIIVKNPVERARVYLMLSVFHAIVLERRRYGLLGWSKVYDFSNTDFDVSLYVVDKWLNSAAEGRSNIAPDKIPWFTIKSLLSEVIYGGQMDSIEDIAVLHTLAETYFSPKVFDLNYVLSDSEPKLVVPNSSKILSFTEWIDKLPTQEPSTWLLLSANAKRL